MICALLYLLGVVAWALVAQDFKGFAPLFGGEWPGDAIAALGLSFQAIAFGTLGLAVGAAFSKRSRSAVTLLLALAMVIYTPVTKLSLSPRSGVAAPRSEPPRGLNPNEARFDPPAVESQLYGAATPAAGRFV